VVTLLLVANIIKLGADLGAMGDALELLIGGRGQLYRLLFGIVCIVLEVWLSYPRYAEILKWTTLSLFSYVAVVFVADVPWGAALKSLFIPNVDLTGAYAMAMVAILVRPLALICSSCRQGRKSRRNTVITPSHFGCRRRVRALGRALAGTHNTRNG
jgi:hypothetical protein